MRDRDIKTGRYSDVGCVPEDPLRVKLDALALRFAEQLLGERPSGERELLGDDVAMFKALANYYTGTRSRVPIKPPEEPDEDGFAALKERINGAADAGHDTAETDS